MLHSEWDGKGIHEFLGREEKTLNEKLHCRLAGSTNTFGRSRTTGLLTLDRRVVQKYSVTIKETKTE